MTGMAKALAGVVESRQSNGLHQGSRRNGHAQATLLARAIDESPEWAASSARRVTKQVFEADAVATVVPAVEWDLYEPRGSYARYGRPLLDLVLVVLTAPPIFVIGLLVALANLAYFRDLRRVLYLQPRVGRRGRIFQIYKFRTMRDSSHSAHESWSLGQDKARVTWLGRLLRNSHLDELPQFLNILKGEMSFVGPRPEMVEVEQWAAEHIPGFSTRLVLKPGITGWAQITQGYTGRSVEEYAKKFALTEIYRKHPAFRTDLAILVRTIVWMIRGRGWQWNAPHKSEHEVRESRDCMDGRQLESV